MPNSGVISTSGIYGTDGVTPIYDADGRFQIWALSELFMGSAISPGDHRYVGKIGDLVVDTDLFLWYIITNIDLATLAPTLVEKTAPVSSGAPTDEDILLGTGPGTTNDAFRVYVDTSVNPHTVAVDAACELKGSLISYVRIFRGADLTDQGNILSLIYDSAGNIVGDKIPLEKVLVPSGTNVAIWAVPVCYTMQEPPNGEQVTIVGYSDAGGVVYKRSLTVENTAFIRAPNAATKYITGISLECPFLSTSDPRVINLPQNVLLPGLNMMGVVHYSDGSIIKMPVDGTKFTLLGLDAYLATVVGQQVSVVLRYQLSAGEVAYTLQVGQVPQISETYKVVTAVEDNAYSVKLFGYPEWLDSISGYRLRWWMYTGNRDVVYDVTGLVDYSQSPAPFNPTLYGAQQTIVVGLNLNAVNGSYRNFRHVQTETLALIGPGTQRTTNWQIYFDQNQIPPYGINNHADLTFVNSNLYHLKYDMGETDVNAWLARVYIAARPLIDPTKEQAPLTPTHFRIKYGAFDYVFPISQFGAEQIVGNGLNNNDTLYIEFLFRTPDTDLQLAIAGLPIYQTNP
jgi:hypothetical protein